jgi:hypothetical protein
VISFRYHIVTIIAVFLALAIGLLGGAAFVQPALQEQLQDQTDRLRNDLDDRTQQIGDLRDQMAALNGFADSVMPYLITGKLTGTPVVLVTQTEVEDEVLAQTQSALSNAGARILTTASAARDARERSQRPSTAIPPRPRFICIVAGHLGATVEATSGIVRACPTRSISSCSATRTPTSC